MIFQDFAKPYVKERKTAMLDKNFPFYILIFFTTLSLTFIIEKALIPLLVKRAKQPIYSEGPKWHESKNGTPTMGGLAFLISISATLIAVSISLYAKGSTGVANSILLSLGYAVLNSVIGLFDDLKKLKKKENKGLSPKQKLIFQSASAVIFLTIRAFAVDNPTALSFSFGLLDVGFFYYPVAFLILVGIVNMANLTDGIDGLATGVGFAGAVSLFYISVALVAEVAFISSAIIGAMVGFLFFNINPAKIFMGDTGSLFIGALIVSSTFMLSNPIITLSINSVYMIEGFSVIIQVAYYKLTQRRLFKMAPLHHHLEKCGWSENKICFVAILTTLVTSIPAYILYVP